MSSIKQNFYFFQIKFELINILSRPATYLNVINTHRLGLVKIHEKINKGEPEIGRSKGALLF